MVFSINSITSKKFSHPLTPHPSLLPFNKTDRVNTFIKIQQALFFITMEQKISKQYIKKNGLSRRLCLQGRTMHIVLSDEQCLRIPLRRFHRFFLVQKKFKINYFRIDKLNKI